MTDAWDEAARLEPSRARILETALEQAKRFDDGEIDPEHPDCPLCRAAAGQDVTLIETIAQVRNLCPECGESTGTVLPHE